MPFDYYRRLNRRQQAIYRRSDELAEVALPDAARLRGLAAALRDALAGEVRREVVAACQRLADALADALEVPRFEVRVLAHRPSRTWGELHGLYESADGSTPARITLWMRTAQRRQVVAPKTFLRTLLHELCHHLDYELFELADSFHTEGFFRRESSLMRQLWAPAG